MRSGRKKTVSPIMRNRPRPVLVAVGAVLLFSLAVGNVYLSVLRVRYGQEIQELKREVAYIGSDVRDLRSQRATLTSLASIEHQAMELGMIYPRKLPQTLRVEVFPGEIPPTWSDPSTIIVPRDAASGQSSLAMAGGGQ